MIQFRDDGTGMGKLYDRSGKAVYGGRHIPREKRLLGHRWPAVVTFEGRTFLDAGRLEYGGFRVYCEAPQVETWD